MPTGREGLVLFFFFKPSIIRIIHFLHTSAGCALAGNRNRNRNRLELITDPIQAIQFLIPTSGPNRAPLQTWLIRGGGGGGGAGSPKSWPKAGGNESGGGKWQWGGGRKWLENAKMKNRAKIV